MVMSVPPVMTAALAPPGPKAGPTSPSAPAPVVLRPGKRRFYPPALLALGLTAWLAGHGAVVLERTGDLGRAIGSSRHQLIGPVVLGFLLAVLVAERLWPAVRRPLLARGHVQDALYLLLYALAVVPLVVLIGVGFSDTLHHAAPWLVLPSTAFLPSWAAIGIGIVAMDGCNWLAHWANHRFTALWRLHALHHSQDEMSILTTFRTHPLVHTSFLLTVVPSVALLSYASVPPTAIVIYLVLATFPHANLRWTFGPLGRLFVSPAYHRIHHAAVGRNDLNLGTVLTLWDVLAHRAVFPVRGGAVIDTGIAGRPLPLEQTGSRLRALRTLGAQLAEPFLTPMAFRGRQEDLP
jgi:sterol desaturase/sphingolipid hydroxylase (fatty acid hydroxylase superfamily)